MTTPWIDDYLSRSGLFSETPGIPVGWDELTGGTGEIRPAWRDVVGTLEHLGPDGMGRLTDLVDRMLENNGVTYTPIGARAGRDGTLPEHQWPLDPIPLVVPAEEWAALEAGLVQRARLLDALLTDIYGERSTMRSGLLPPDLVLRHPYYLRPLHGVRIPGSHQLFFHAVDLCRGPDGRFLAIGDRAQAPSGSGFALAGRRVIAKVMPELYRRTAPRGLSAYFHAIRGALSAVAPSAAGDDPRIVLLSPGTHSETAFDQAFLASLLGVQLVESSDLTVRGGRLYMRALGRYEPVDVVLRRVDADYADPLDLRPDSALGVVGLVEAARRGTVTVVNTLGSGVVENPGLLPYLPRLAREILGEELLLPSQETYWCGDPASLSHVRAHLGDLIIKPIGGDAPVVPARMTAKQRESLLERIAADPARWVGQPPPRFSDAPAVSADAGLGARRVGLRTFAVAHQSGYVVMPGALGRVIRDDVLPPTVLAGGADAAKDVWVGSLSAAVMGAPLRVLDSSDDLISPLDMAVVASPRVLEDLYWFGRYAVRTEDLTRLLSITRDQVDIYRFRSHDPASAVVPVLLEAIGAVTGTGSPVPQADPIALLRNLVLDPTIPGTIAQSLAGLHETARAVRDQLSGDTWLVLAGVERAVGELEMAVDDVGPVLLSTQAAVLSGMLALSGMAAENMVRDPGWYLMDIGRRLERAQQLVAMVRATLAREHDPEMEPLLIDSVLTAAESAVTYRRRYRSHVQVGTLLELLLFDADNPRALGYQIAAIAEDLRRLPDASGTSKPERLVEEIGIRLRRVQPSEMDDVTRDEDGAGHRVALVEFLDAMGEDLRKLSEELASAHFFRSRPMVQFGSGLGGAVA